MRKPIIDYEGIYEISHTGQIFNVQTGKKKKFHLHHSGYYNISLHKDGKPKYFIRARLIAIHFIPNPLGLKEVNHKNGIKTDDRIKNLEWVSPSENIIHYYDVLGKGITRKVKQFTMDGEFIKEWPSLSKAARSLKKPSGNLTTVCQGKNKYAYGFKWQYA